MAAASLREELSIKDENCKSLSEDLAAMLTNAAESHALLEQERKALAAMAAQRDSLLAEIRERDLRAAGEAHPLPCA